MNQLYLGKETNLERVAALPFVGMKLSTAKQLANTLNTLNTGLAMV